MSTTYSHFPAHTTHILRGFRHFECGSYRWRLAECIDYITILHIHHMYWRSLPAWIGTQFDQRGLDHNSISFDCMRDCWIAFQLYGLWTMHHICTPQVCVLQAHSPRIRACEVRPTTRLTAQEVECACMKGNSLFQMRIRNCIWKCDSE